jgi:hypothetical protein
MFKQINIIYDILFVGTLTIIGRKHCWCSGILPWEFCGNLTQDFSFGAAKIEELRH